MDLADWLRQSGLEQYEPAFQANHITAALLPDLTQDDLRDLGIISVGHRRILMNAIAALRADHGAAREPLLSTSHGERRQVTILFADLAGYTAIAAQRDPEETHRLLGRFFQAIDSIVSRYGGAIERHIGDNVMGVFGAPVAHGDDPLRAVLAAIDIHRAVTDVGAEVGIPLAVHIGIAAGEVMASQTGSSLRAAYGVVGSPVN